MRTNLSWGCRRAVELTVIRSVEALTRLIVCLVPRDRAYDRLIRLSGVLYTTTHPLYAYLRRRSPKQDYRALLLRDMLCMATRKGGIPIRAQLEGGEMLDAAYAAHGRVILCTAHFGLTMAIFSALEARGLDAALIGRQVSAKRDRLHWGCSGPANLIESDGLCLVRGRQALEAGQVVTVLPEMSRSPANQPDTGDDGFDINTNVFEFAQLVGVPVLFFGAGVGGDGAIVLDLIEPAHSLPRTPTEAAALAEEYRAFLEVRTGRPCSLLPQPAKPETPQARAA